MYDGAEDGPPLGFQVFYDATIDEVITYFDEECGVEPSVWSPIPDQLPGCLDEWIAPVRAFQDENGKVVAGAYERLESENWIKFTI
jgi:hypothetical protein